MAKKNKKAKRRQHPATPNELAAQLAARANFRQLARIADRLAATAARGSELHAQRLRARELQRAIRELAAREVARQSAEQLAPSDAAPLLAQPEGQAEPDLATIRRDIARAHISCTLQIGGYPSDWADLLHAHGTDPDRFMSDLARSMSRKQ